MPIIKILTERSGGIVKSWSYGNCPGGLLMFETLTDWTSLAFFAGGAASGMLGYAWSKRRGVFEQPKSDFYEFIQNINEGYYRSSIDGKQLFANKALVNLNGYSSQEEMLSCVNNIAQEWYVDPNRRQEFQDLLHRDGYVENFISEIYRHKTRERIWISENARLKRDADGRVVYYEGTIREFSETMARLQLEDLHTKLTNRVPGALVQARWRRGGGFELPYFSDGLRAIVGNMPYKPTSDASALFSILHPDDFQMFIDSAEASARNQTEWNCEFRVHGDHEGETWLSLNAVPEIEEDRSCLWHGYLSDITDKKAAEKRIHSLAYYDTLTGLPNRQAMLDAIDTAIHHRRSRNQQAAVMFLDLDNFKGLNDTRGHAEGDELLIEISNRLRTCVAGKAQVGRFGGDEFVVLIDSIAAGADYPKRIAADLAFRIRRMLDEPCMLASGVFHTSCSIGVAMIEDHLTTGEDVLKQADLAMYTAKEQGKNQVKFCDEDMQLRVKTRVELMNDLRAAIGTKQLELHYQMQVDAQSKVVGAEALLRWNHPERGLVPPDEFIPLAEQNGLILRLSDWLLVETFETLARWQRDPQLSGISLSINISAQQFHNQAFGQMIAELIQTYGINPQRLILEMTEHVLSDDLKLVDQLMRGLKELGVGFSLDDFGTGYSSLKHLRDLPFDEVKIDGTFVQSLDRSENDRDIVRSVLGIAKALGLKTVAEWVEKPSQYEFLISEGCDTFQGYLFGPAMPLKRFEDVARLPLVNRSAAAPMQKTNVPVRYG